MWPWSIVSWLAGRRTTTITNTNTNTIISIIIIIKITTYYDRLTGRCLVTGPKRKGQPSM